MGFDRSKAMPKTQAQATYCLTDKDLAGLVHSERPNPRARSAPPMKLYAREDLERAALARWGGLAGLEAERERRQARREQRSIDSYFRQQQGGAPGQGGDAPGPPQQPVRYHRAGGTTTVPAGLEGLPPLLAERVCLVAAAQAAGSAAQAQAGRPSAEAPAAPQAPRYVLYWMQTAVRAHENPALDVAAHAARSAGLPLVVAAFVLASHPFGSLRRHGFLLEGLADAQAELRGRGGDLAVYVEGRSEPAAGEGDVVAAPHGSPLGSGSSFGPPAGFGQSLGFRRLVGLAAAAAVVVTEDLPVPPHADWVQELARALPPGTALCAVDAACVHPARLSGRAYDRAHAFRAATDAARRDRIRRLYPAAAAACSGGGGGGGTEAAGAVFGPQAVVPPALQGVPMPAGPALAELLQAPWAPLDLGEELGQACSHGGKAEGPSAAIDALLRACGPRLYDQAVPMVPHLRGGSRAGYARWEAFRRQGLPLYAARRNDAMQRDGVSRMSAYLHWGMVSPFKLAREASLDRSPGSAKFLDELLTWREIAHVHCLHTLQHKGAAALHGLAGLPAWARATLAAHAADPRRSAKSSAQLEAGGTGDAFWDAAQQQLVATGELHNNTRMTWGKAPLLWTRSPEAALRTVLHLNHRYALDGCNPCSYGGVLWCFGLFDGPKEKEGTAVSGSLRRRPTSAAARRLDVAAYRALPP